MGKQKPKYYSTQKTKKKMQNVRRSADRKAAAAAAAALEGMPEPPAPEEPRPATPRDGPPTPEAFQASTPKSVRLAFESEDGVRQPVWRSSPKTPRGSDDNVGRELSPVRPSTPKSPPAGAGDNVVTDLSLVWLTTPKSPPAGADDNVVRDLSLVRPTTPKSPPAGADDNVVRDLSLVRPTTPKSPPGADDNVDRELSLERPTTPKSPGFVFELTVREPSPVRPFRERTETQEPREPQELTGRRVVSIVDFLKQIADMSKPGSHFKGQECSFLDSEFVRETQMGFRSILYFKCKKCTIVTSLDTDKCENDALGVNRAMVSGALAAGGGFANLDEMAAAVNMPCMASNTYTRHERALGRTFEELALAKMLLYGKIEVELAIKARDFCPDGTPWIRVICDGMWCKRVFGNKYDALSGVAFIIGFRTGKILFYSVRNKHCFICALDENKKVNPVRDHVCARNFRGSSGQMEAAIILEGFKASEEMHKCRFLELVGDRDSSVHNLLVEKMPYGPLEIVRKIDCKNHLLRNYRSWTLQLSNNTNLPMPDTVDRSDPKAVQSWRKETRTLRCLVRDNYRRLSTGISKASIYHGKGEKALHHRVEDLRADILNVAAHVFGDHTKCAEYFCQTAKDRAGAAGAAGSADTAGTQYTAQSAPEADRRNWVPRFMATGVWSKLMANLNLMADHASSLIHNVNNNICEVANSQVAKFINGKRIFYSRKNSFDTRCAAAAFAMNCSGQWRKLLHQELQKDGGKLGKYTALHSDRKAKRLQWQRQQRRTRRLRGTLRKNWKVVRRDKHYGLEALAPGDRDESVDDPTDLQPLQEDTHLERRMNELTAELEADLGRREAIALYKQRSNEWIKARKRRLTACNFGPVCRRPKTHTCKNLVKNILHAKSTRTASMQHGNDMEDAARLYFEKMNNVLVKTTGLVVDRQLPFLAASPDGLIGDDTLLEIKCPTSGADYPSAEDAVRAKKLPYLKFGDDGQSLCLDKRSDHYYQIQGQLHITSRLHCHLFICQFKTEKRERDEPPQVLWHKTLTIKRDDDFWSREMEPQMTDFYYGCLLQEIASPRFLVREKVDDIRELPSVLTAREEQAQLAEEKRREKEERQMEMALRAEERRMEKERKEEERKQKKEEKERAAEERRKRTLEGKRKSVAKRQRLSK